METTTTRRDSRAQADAVNVNTVFQTKIDSNAESTVDIDRRYLLLLLTPYAESYGLLMGNKIDAYHALGAAAAHHHNNTRLDIFPKVHHGSFTIFGGRPPHLLETNK